LANFALATIFAVLYHLLKGLEVSVLILGLLRAGVLINLVLGVFNLFPIPPLDGSKILISQLPYNAAKQFERIEPYGFLILIMLMMVPFGGSSLLSTILGFFVGILSSLLGF
jgi:Zn-dependent protease